jgi:uncharacterized membrane protein YidH (DUF202 family)
MDCKSKTDDASFIINSIQLLLAEKRTSLSSLRTGIAVFALPLSALSILIATSKFYEFQQVLRLMIPLLVLCAILVFLGIYLIVKSIVRIHNQDEHIAKLKRKNNVIESLLT